MELAPGFVRLEVHLKSSMDPTGMFKVNGQTGLFLVLSHRSPRPSKKTEDESAGQDHCAMGLVRFPMPFLYRNMPQKADNWEIHREIWAGHSDATYVTPGMMAVRI